MSEELDDVTAESSTAPATEMAPVSAPVSAALPTDRPVENVLAEMNRKYERLQNQIGQVFTLLQSQSQPQAPAKGQATDEELWSLAQQGDRGAFEMYQSRIAQREAQKEYESRTREALIDQQLGALAARYPVFNDSTHPLTQTVQSAYQIMLSRGYTPGKATMLDAMKTAIADRPDLVADMVGRAPEQARVSATRRAQAGQTGATTRESMPRPGQATQVNPQQAKLAQAYGIKDPAKAIERFKKRQEDGRSQLGMVANAITEEL